MATTNLVSLATLDVAALLPVQPSIAVQAVAASVREMFNPAHQVSALLAGHHQRWKAATMQAADVVAAAKATTDRFQRETLLAVGVGSKAVEATQLWQGSLDRIVGQFAEVARPIPALLEVPQLWQGTIEQSARPFTDPFSSVAAMGGMASQMSVMAGLGGWSRQLTKVPALWPATSQLMAGLAPQVMKLVESFAGSTDWMQKSLAGFSELAVRIARAAIALGKRIYFEIFAAQDAAVRGDVEEVSAFFRRWMELPRSEWQARMEAGMDVLVEARLEEFDPDTAVELLEWIEKETNRHFRRGRRLLGDTKLNHVRVVSLEELPLRLGRPDVSAESFLPASCSAEDRALIVLNQVQDDRLEALLGGLDPVESRVEWTRRMTGATWQEAAMMCGLPESEGERVRAKLGRRAKKIQASTAGASSSFST